MFDGICDALHHELETLDNRLMGGKAPMSSQDLDNIDKMAHALKSLATYSAMKGEGRHSYGRYREEYPEYRRY